MKITTDNTKHVVLPTKATSLRKSDLFLLPRYKARIVSVTEHKVNEDLLIVKFRITEGPNKDKIYDTLIPRNSMVDRTNSSVSRVFYYLLNHYDMVFAWLILIGVVSAFVAYGNMQ